ncbi:MAG: beta-ketoacyl synthase N-terminal-like domain-containing protein [Micromonosporaceae bacterium]
MTSDLTVLAVARWPEPGDAAPPPLPGYVVSSFNPLVAAVADRCLRRRHGEPPTPADIGDRTAMVIVSASGDAVSQAHVHAAVGAGERVGPLFFFQSAPNSVAGHVAARWGLRGPVVCVRPIGSPRATALAQAELLFRDGDADLALLVLAEQAASHDSAEALLVTNAGASHRAMSTEGAP